jgi:cell division inhibitor SepF
MASPDGRPLNPLVLTEGSVVRRNDRDWLGLVERDNDAIEVQGDDEDSDGGFAMGNGIQIAVVRPRNFRDAATVGDYFRQDIPVIINLEDMDNEDSRRIIDFISGLILGLSGDIEKLSRRTFLIVPGGTAILTTHEALTEEGFFNQALRPVHGGQVLSAGRPSSVTRPWLSSGAMTGWKLRRRAHASPR